MGSRENEKLTRKYRVQQGAVGPNEKWETWGHDSRVAEDMQPENTKTLEISGSNKSTVGPNEHRVPANITRGYLVLESTVADAPVTRRAREKERGVPGAWDTGGKGAAPSCTGVSVFSVADAGVVP